MRSWRVSPELVSELLTRDMGTFLYMSNLFAGSSRTLKRQPRVLGRRAHRKPVACPVANAADRQHYRDLDHDANDAGKRGARARPKESDRCRHRKFKVDELVPKGPREGVVCR